MNKITYGSHRLVVGAHYGVRDFLAQRVTAVVMAIFTLVLLAQVIFASGHMGYDAWAAIFSAQWMKFLTYTVILSLVWHAWVGVQSIWMDYVHHDGLRLFFYCASLAWLAGCAGWAFQVLWRM